MTYSRSEKTLSLTTRQAVQSRGCLSGFLLPPLMVLCFGLFLSLATSKLKLPDPQINNMSASANSTLAPLFTPEILNWSANISKWASEYGLDPNLAATVMQIESCGNPDALSNAGATGLFQVMPFHFLVYENAFDPDINASRGLNYLAKSLERSGGDARLALAGYNGGIGVISRPEFTWPAETRRYAYWGSGIFSDAVHNAATSSRLDEWLTAGGSSLCRKARERLGIFP